MALEVLQQYSVPGVAVNRQVGQTIPRRMLQINFGTARSQNQQRWKLRDLCGILLELTAVI